MQYKLAVGLGKGHKVTKNEYKPRPSRRKGVSEVDVTSVAPVIEVGASS